MRRRKVLICWAALQAGSSILTCLLLLLTTGQNPQQVAAGIVPPPWSDPAQNPCASMSGGWQLLYWAPLKKCFKIFTLGYPCPATMELSPTAVSAKRKDAPAAECRCPPGTALSPLHENVCYKLYERGPCQPEEYFQPVPDQVRSQILSRTATGNRWGTCKRPLHCPEDMLFWPRDNKCYARHGKGPCSRGKLLVRNEEGLAECRCEDVGELATFYYPAEESCYEHYTKGPCSTPGHIFLPGGRCDCQRHLPHYHAPHQMCYELDTPGPCPPGHIFRIPDEVQETTGSTLQLLPRAQCQCKEGYVPWSDGICYRLYTRGPCGPNEFLVNGTSCVRNFCGKNRLYFPAEDSCYRIGSQGPCALHQVVIFDFTARPSIDGISYNGMCGCSGVLTNLDQQCTGEGADKEQNICESTPGMVEINGQCHKLYSRGPCGAGQWLEPLKSQATNGTSILVHASRAKCVCRPGYTPSESDQRGMSNCSAPSVSLARYLTNERLNSKFLNDLHLGGTT
ncbi:uncharacterized protein LOC6738115 isoform X1 [Drosophila simulans]|uniref:Uncharacterized protein, isoform C n=1 Tax=Drosophila simulans TaxID=7240 RepID=A0A0J9RWR5_DROSI|nr:uncharacterized protein LOC6738115 isoform X1 [Drosophila simulans]XP_016031954.1 uncharacterized protein LOC6738115 isoform X1 [Drosophila simulans]XP_039149623.1 uncharacterized protein LOC6738115 isoform X1 [Drosophila simulans]XP_044778877.1 uncharacterized protein LOC6738115 isoform X1 [Drosophila simulans]KMY99699.1 uncharacterized protein Dsimw501_GD12576, isoform C [Drosophila simulans]KMY99701.1 uncharacterized protein Dsimw501_GD12576, isoform E [Drosophila simulans]KMY99704.1 un